MSSHAVLHLAVPTATEHAASTPVTVRDRASTGEPTLLWTRRRESSQKAITQPSISPGALRTHYAPWTGCGFDLCASLGAANTQMRASGVRRRSRRVGCGMQLKHRQALEQRAGDAGEGVWIDRGAVPSQKLAQAEPGRR
ncbi:hypothetical protein BDV96DRAFT_631042 [Lophiotrema nucula]|uniref:Uncharacterized protein n=1 Tax=Lophiotrema nucula TaxID=690887 RepID=A0A6A5ZCS1_9PLEO|nr:hypothetical protein BDV96DRAFT_631042 [Lophiotrema nucula]